MNHLPALLPQVTRIIGALVTQVYQARPRCEPSLTARRLRVCNSSSVGATSQTFRRGIWQDTSDRHRQNAAVAAAAASRNLGRGVNWRRQRAAKAAAAVAT
jgi:hypothetical protein